MNYKDYYKFTKYEIFRNFSLINKQIILINLNYFKILF